MNFIVKIYDKIQDFYIKYEDVVNLSLFMFVVVACFCYLFTCFDRDMTVKRNIIDQTKKYEVYDNCEYLHESYYCWNEKEVINNE